MTDLPRVSDLKFARTTMVVHLEDNLTLTVPLARFPRLQEATPEERAAWHLVDGGAAVHWDLLDEALTARQILNALYPESNEVIAPADLPKARARPRVRSTPAAGEKHRWAFAPRFRARAFGWKSQPAITRVRQAVSEIKKAARALGREAEVRAQLQALVADDRSAGMFVRQELAVAGSVKPPARLPEKR